MVLGRKGGKGTSKEGGEEDVEDAEEEECCFVRVPCFCLLPSPLLRPPAAGPPLHGGSACDSCIAGKNARKL